MALRVKDRVKLISDRFGDTPGNPIFGGRQGAVIGTVTKADYALPPGIANIVVAWDNGISNFYHEDDLKVAQKHRVRRVKGVKYIKLCSQCKREMEEDEKRYGIGNEFICETCYHKLYGTCSKCRQIILEEIGYTNRDGEFYCRDCYVKLYTTCDRCTKEILREEAVEYDGKLYCNDCFSDEFVQCEDCSEIIPRDEAFRYNNIIYCEDCYSEDYTPCTQCGEVIPNDEIYMDDGGSYCESCYEDRTNREVYNHDYKPAPVFSKQKWENTAYLGIELEIETKNDKYKLADEFINKFGVNNFCYLKEDSSLSNGFEIVTHPHTLQKHREKKWREILRWLKEHGANSYDNKECGLHVHVNRNLLSKLEWHKVAIFFYKCKGHIIHFSKRTEEQIKQWAEFCPPKNTHNANREYTSYCNRYEALNWENDDTVEFRIYRGTLDWKRFWASLNFTASLLDYVRETGVAHFTTKDEYQL